MTLQMHYVQKSPSAKHICAETSSLHILKATVRIGAYIQHVQCIKYSARILLQ